MKTSAFIFIGQSGAGKGTQVALLQKRLEQVDPEKKVLYLETGKRFRELIATNGFTAQKTKEVMDKGLLPPPFLGVHAWTHFLIEEYDGNSHCVMDGTPRVPDEVPLLLSACRFFNWDTHVIYIDVGDEWAYEKTKGRGRADDADEKRIWGRIEWYHQSVVPTIEMLKETPDVSFHHISGEQSIEDVHAEICRELGLS